MEKKQISSGTLLSDSAAPMSGCGTVQASSQEPPQTADDFTASLLRFLEANGYANQNYIVSPTSFRAALALAAAGAGSRTKDELLSAMGFKNMEELNQWYSSVAASEARFNKWLQNASEHFEDYKVHFSDPGNAPDGAFSLENSIWRNTKAPGELSETYKQYVKKHYNAMAENVSADKITDAVNDWVNENTNGLIPKISDDLSLSDLILANTLYLRTAWEEEFDEYRTRKGDFTTWDGRTVKKKFMHQRHRFAFYEDDETKLVCLPMKGEINALFVLGNLEHAMEKLRSASFEIVDVTLPKFETETSLSGKELVRFCKARGAELAFTPNADFSGMSEAMELYITDIIQKAKIKTDEDGIEAAAVTTFALALGAPPIEKQPEIKVFKADRPFKFILLTDSETPEPLFCGQIVE